MKNKKILPIVVLMLATACNFEEKEIEQVSQKYLTAMGNYQFTEAAKYASEQTQSITLKFFNEVMLPHTDPSFITQNTPATITINETSKTTDSTAIVTYTKTTPICTQHDTLQLIKENGEWKADVVIIIPSLLNINQGPRKIDLTHITNKGDKPQIQNQAITNP